MYGSIKIRCLCWQTKRTILTVSRIIQCGNSCVSLQSIVKTLNEMSRENIPFFFHTITIATCCLKFRKDFSILNYKATFRCCFWHFFRFKIFREGGNMPFSHAYDWSLYIYVFSTCVHKANCALLNHPEERSTWEMWCFHSRMWN